MQGYREITWGEARPNTDIFIIDKLANNGQGRAYGPYRLHDASQHMLTDPSQFNSQPWVVTEPIAVLDNGQTTKAAQPPMVQQTLPGMTPATSGVITNRHLMGLIRDWVILEIAAKAQNLSAADRAQLERDAMIKADLLDQALTDWKKQS